VIHRQFDFRSVDAFIEKQFRLPHLVSYNRSVGDLARMFDFRQTPLPPLILKPRGCGESSAGVPGY
jgi:hypothetical protein